MGSAIRIVSSVDANWDNMCVMVHIVTQIHFDVCSMGKVKRSLCTLSRGTRNKEGKTHEGQASGYKKLTHLFSFYSKMDIQFVFRFMNGLSVPLFVNTPHSIVWEKNYSSVLVVGVGGSRSGIINPPSTKASTV